jgi:hypothetical protein
MAKFNGQTIRLPLSSKPDLRGYNGDHVKTLGDWRDEAEHSRKGAGKEAARQHAQDAGWSAIEWPSGRLSLYISDGNNMLRLRFA